MTSKTVQVIENLLETPWTPQFLFPPKANNDLDILLPESQQEDICYILQKNWLAPKLSSTIYTFDKIYNLKTEQYFRNAVKEAAIQSGFALHVRDSRSRDNCLYVLFSCVCSRVSEPTNNVKKTTTKAAVDKERTCPFSFRVRVTTEAIELLPATSRNEWVHCFHRELEGALVRRPMSLLTDENKKMLNNLEISCITPSTMAHILTNKTGLVWSRKQLEIVNKVEKLNTDSSPAEELLSYLSSLKNGNHSEDMDPSKSSDSFDSFEEISDDEMNELQPHTLSVLSQVTNENKNIGRHKKINECENYNYFHSEMKNMLSMAERHPECLEFIKNGFRDMKAGIIKQILTKRSRNSSQITTETEEVSRLVSSQVEMKYRSDYKGKRFKNIFET